MDGAGTSAATPQIAAAVALWIAKYRTELEKYPEPWMRVQAARFALFESALKQTASMDDEETLAPDGSFHVEVVATVLQRRRVPINPKDPNGPQMWFRGGATLILDPRPGRCEVR